VIPMYGSRSVLLLSYRYHWSTSQLAWISGTKKAIAKLSRPGSGVFRSSGALVTSQ
jgi:hypothetical protein